MRETSLGEEFMISANYGLIAFDHYALSNIVLQENWDYHLPREEDGAQWRRLVMEYLDLSHRNRLPYKNKTTTVLIGETDEGIQSRLTPANIERVLKPFQTIRERNLSRLGTPANPIWITACYEESLHQQYCDLERQSEVGGAAVKTEMVLSDPDVYNINGDINALAARIVERLPALFDGHSAIRRGVGQDLVSLSRRMEALVYVADKESVLGGFVKVLWFDGHGQLLLASRLEPEELEGMTGLWADGYSMRDAVDEERVLAIFKDPPKDKPVKQGSDAEWETESEYGSAC
ncbi:hypothetical protein BBO_05138 [Beauveria brongniartii RCEF 3172]|uniref:Uncharacterized protein n=1 Tax=Beauveria brongniartii RCEF 3172 TaxID=1081107 RepID=A0A162HS57_9HYPO|nr:hypothetical protein BBO_05138 [Beauveria brongniartii RCEF 3172]